MTKNKIKVGTIASWIFGIFFILVAFVAVFSEPLPALIFLLMALILLPPVHKHLYERWAFKLSRGLKVIALSFSFVALAYAFEPIEPLNQPLEEDLLTTESATENEDLAIRENNSTEPIEVQEIPFDPQFTEVNAKGQEPTISSEALPKDIVESIPSSESSMKMYPLTAPELKTPPENVESSEISEMEMISPTPVLPEPDPIVPTPTCDSNYSGCVPIASDVDCGGGSGDGPQYLYGVAEVIGSDIYDLDRDNDGTACE